MEILKEIDLRNSTDADGNNYFVVFCSRNSPNPTTLPGHAYVVWGIEDAANSRSSQKSFGFYPDPDESSKVVLSSVPGKLLDEATQGVPSTFLTARLIAQVNKQPYTDSQSQIDIWRTSEYNLFSRNCINFVQAVATTLGLFPPEVESFSLPTNYLEKLIENVDS